MKDGCIMKKRSILIVIAVVVLLVITGFLMFSSNYHQQLMFNNSMNDTLRSFLLTLTARNSWIVTLCIATLFELYSSFRIDARNKELEDKEE